MATTHARPRITLTDDEIEWCLKGHRARLVELITRPVAGLAGKRLAKVAAKHHEGRIALLRKAGAEKDDAPARG